MSDAVAVATEREVKLGTWPGFRLPDLDGVAPWVRAEPLDEVTLDATYYDTADLRLSRASITVRHRAGEGGADGRWTVKLPKSKSSGGALERTELTLDAPGGSMPAGIERIVKGVARGGPLAPVAQLTTRRRLVDLRDGGGRRLGEVCDDEVSVVEDGRVAARFREVEVEAAAGAPSGLLPLVVAHLRAAGAGQPDPTSKLVRALGPRALAPPDPPVPSLGDDPTVGLVVRAAIASSVQRMLSFDPALRFDAPVVAIHQSRVATRRLRSDLKTFAPLLDEAWAEGIRAGLRDFAAALGSVRDADVLSERLEHAGRELGRVDGAHAVRLVRRLRRQRQERLDVLLETIDAPEHLALLDRLVEAAKEPRLLPAAEAPAAETLPGLVAGPWQKVQKAANRIGPEAADRELHDLRIRVKRARYACEAAARALPAATPHAEALATLQGVLGDQHDAVVAQEWLRATVAAGTSRQQAFAAGLLLAQQAADAAAVRESWRSAWDAADRKNLRRWLRT